MWVSSIRRSRELTKIIFIFSFAFQWYKGYHWRLNPGRMMSIESWSQRLNHSDLVEVGEALRPESVQNVCCVHATIESAECQDCEKNVKGLIFCHITPLGWGSETTQKNVISQRTFFEFYSCQNTLSCRVTESEAVDTVQLCLKRTNQKSLPNSFRQKQHLLVTDFFSVSWNREAGLHWTLRQTCSLVSFWSLCDFSETRVFAISFG